MVEAMTVAEVHGVLARTAATHGTARRDSVEREAQRALALDPNELNALAARFYSNGALPLAERRDFARRATAAHPNRALAWIMARDATLDPAQRSQAANAALRAELYSAAARAASAQEKIWAGQPETALEDATFAVRLSPSLQTVRAFVVALAANHRCIEARDAAGTLLRGYSERELLTLREGSTPGEIWCRSQPGMSTR